METTLNDGRTPEGWKWRIADQLHHPRPHSRGSRLFSSSPGDWNNRRISETGSSLALRRWSWRPDSLVWQNLAKVVLFASSSLAALVLAIINKSVSSGRVFRVFPSFPGFAQTLFGDSFNMWAHRSIFCAQCESQSVNRSSDFFSTDFSLLQLPKYCSTSEIYIEMIRECIRCTKSNKIPLLRRMQQWYSLSSVNSN
jgi:hypothetical protein